MKPGDLKTALDRGARRPRRYASCDVCSEYRGFAYKLKLGAGFWALSSGLLEASGGKSVRSSLTAS